MVAYCRKIKTPTMISWIDQPEALLHWCQHWQSAPFLAVDTEFVRINTYRPILCLVQLSDGENTVLIDTLAFPTSPDLQPLWTLLHQPHTVKLSYSAGQDYEIFLEHSGDTPKPLFDAQVASTIYGWGAQYSYGAFIEQQCGVVLDKSLSRTDWAKRPLNQAEKDYAAADVSYLAALYPRLTGHERAAWAWEDSARWSEASRYQEPVEDAWQRLRGLIRLKPEAQQRAARMAVWREGIAQEKNRPRKWILDDEPLYKLAERPPTHPAGLAAAGVPPKTISKYGTDLMRLLQPQAGDDQAKAEEVRFSPEQKAALKSLQNQVQALSEALGIPATYLANRASLEAVVLQGAQAAVPLNVGWRKQQHVALPAHLVS
jgi:ribonuclease D